uniref:Uncharacterized protein n=1 Tax=Anopheles atroparvus TaxID=41427 RepID=A0A182J2D6_ANOAO
MSFLRGRRWQMVADGLETVGVGLVLHTVQLAIGGSVGVSTGDYLLRLFRAQVAQESLFLVLDSVASGIAIKKNKDGDGSRLLLEVVTGVVSCGAARAQGISGATVRRPGRLLRIVGSTERTLLRLQLRSRSRRLAERCNGRVVALLSAGRWRKVLVGRGQAATELAVASRSVEDVRVAAAALVGRSGSRRTVQVIEPGGTRQS